MHLFGNPILAFNTNFYLLVLPIANTCPSLKTMKKYCLTLDLKDDVGLVAEYEEHHKAIWPEIRNSITSSGIGNMEIYRLGSRLVMLIEANDDFSFSKKAVLDAGNPKVQEWEDLMWKYQQPIRGAFAGEKWVLMDKIFQL
jgi:L-rhamnose mutarotase